MDTLRFGVIGVGGMGGHHCRFIAAMDRASLAGVCDKNPETAQRVGEEHGVPAYSDYRKLIDAGDCDAVIIATPHYQHPTIGVYAFNKGLHVLCEKPLAVSVKAGDRLLSAAKKAAKRGVKFGVMFQMRTVPVHRKAKQIVDSGALGELYRTELQFGTIRTQAYYDSGSWRGTWKGEGGGVLLNQAPHPLDLFVWLGGMPKKVTGTCRTSKHKIEVEDEVHALLEYDNGAMGYLYCSVNEAPDVMTLTLCGEKGKLQLRGTELSLVGLDPPVGDFLMGTDAAWGKLDVKEVTVQIDEAPEGHAAVIADFVNAILDDTPMLCPGEDGLESLELANALLLAGKTKRSVSLPLDRDKFEDLLTKLKES